MEDPLWSKSFPGHSPKVFLTDSTVLFQFADPHLTPPAKPTRLVCFDHRGEVRWDRSDVTALLSLDEDRWLGRPSAGEALQVLDADGKVVAQRATADAVVINYYRDVFETNLRASALIARYGNRLAIADAGSVTLTDLSLSPQAEFAWPAEFAWSEDGAPAMSCLGRDRFYWIRDEYIRSCDFNGCATRIAAIPEEGVEQALREHEESTGTPAIQGFEVAIPKDAPDARPYVLGQAGEPRFYRIGDRIGEYGWKLTYDAEASVLFMSSTSFPHVLACLEESGELRWCRYISSACCGGTAYRLPSGLLVTCTSCGGVLTWLDESGHILFQSERPEGSGLEIAYSPEVTVLMDGAAIVAGGPGLASFRNGVEEWRLEKRRLETFEGFSPRAYAINEANRVLALCFWKDGEDGREASVTVQVRELPERKEC